MIHSTSPVTRLDEAAKCVGLSTSTLRSAARREKLLTWNLGNVLWVSQIALTHYYVQYLRQNPEDRLDLSKAYWIDYTKDLDLSTTEAAALMSTQEAAEYLGITPNALRHEARKRHISVFKWWRFRHFYTFEDVLSYQINVLGLRGVSWDSSRRKFRACLKVDGRTWHLGYFPPTSTQRARGT